ncbi:hypothetical protein FGM00_16300 [Aggregatimonas sangjinii]|uniref:Lipocalin-like domain-containing protein n=1 Tax=Aggregatimonas sangjinii TaxID=2583587 RepID=A0A5B7SXS5_9FLAO|nr:hypothetical protein [Aggregatimonas sangjinii]QCX01594.1 hypothetical protein FGM00_16300 [Aggregatimonas sangjinii]
MKKYSILSILILSLILSASCSVEELLKEEPGNVEQLTSNSPWTFNSFELAWATKTETDTITDQEIENEVNDSYKNLEFTFNSDGTGLTTIRNSEEESLTWTWFFDGNDKLCFDGVCGTDSFTNVKLSENNFSFDLTAGAPSNTEGEKIIYSGRYTFN